MNSLIEKLEGLSGPCRETDLEIWQATRGVLEHPNMQDWLLPHYTGSLDSAVALVPEHFFWTIGMCDLTGHCTIGPDYNGPHGDELKRKYPVDEWHEGISEDIAPGGSVFSVCRSLCIAALRAREGE